ncbi:MAG: TetR/AcrR family transcriptional regulator [Thermodesulfobacteriota bacterium]
MPPRSETNHQKKERESAIFDAACRVFRDKGFHQARMADVAAAAGISYGLVYHYFKSKNDLLDAMTEAWFSSLDRLMDRLLEESPPARTSLEAIADYFLDQYIRRPDLVQVFITEISRSTANLTPDRLARFKNMMARTEEIIRLAQVNGHLRSDLKARYLTFFFLGAIETLLSTMVLDGQPLKTTKHKADLVGAVMTMFLEGAAPEPPSPAG